MTILTWSFLGLVAASASSLVLFLYARQRACNEGHRRRWVVGASALAPFLGLLWLVVALLLHVQITNRLAHQDCGLSGDPYVTLPNGYVLGSLNTYDGYFKAPGFETDVPVVGPGYVRCIIDLQFSDGRFVGTQTDRESTSLRHFTFDTRTRNFQSSGAEEPTNFGDAMTRAHDSPTSYWRLYDQYRQRWPNYVLLVLIVVGEGAIGFWVWRLWTLV